VSAVWDCLGGWGVGVMAFGLGKGIKNCVQEYGLIII
jgi:hypothetical protein